MMQLKSIRFNVLVISLVISGVTSLFSCSTVNDMVEYDIYKAFQNGQKSTNPDAVNKEREKEAEKLKQQGKCPTCRGTGKSPDGRYTCSACNGTGKAF